MLELLTHNCLDIQYIFYVNFVTFYFKKFFKVMPVRFHSNYFFKITGALSIEHISRILMRCLIFLPFFFDLMIDGGFNFLSNGNSQLLEPRVIVGKGLRILTNY